MNKRFIRSLTVIMFLIIISCIAVESNKVTENKFTSDSPFSGVMNVIPDISSLPVIEDNEVEIVAETEPEFQVIETSWLYLQYLKMGYSSEDFYSDLKLLKAIVTAEAGNQSELGKRLVIDCVLNRINSDRWRDDYTISEVVTHSGQFETYTNGAYLTVENDDSVGLLIEQELLYQTNYDVIYFKTESYFAGVPKITQEGDHYFSGEYSY